MSKLKVFIRVICFILIFSAIFCLLTGIFERKTLSGSWNYTAKVNGYINSDEEIEVIGFGSSHMYCSLNPLELSSKFGINSYVLATQQQPVKASYYYMLEALKTQKPKVFIFETFMVNNSDEDVEDAIIYDAIDPLPFSLNKLKMVYDLTKNKEEPLPFFLTLLNYKERWKSLENSDFTFDRKNVSDEYKGYVHITVAKPIQKIKYPKPSEIVDINSEDLEYLDKIVELCRENDIRLILLYAPFSMSADQYSRCCAIENYAKQNNLEFINGCEIIDLFDFDTDFCDEGHMNVCGSAKLTEYIGEFIKEG